MSGADLELMPTYSTKSHPKKKSGDTRNIFDRTVPFFGLILVSLGTVGIMSAFSSPFSLPGGVLYFIVGFSICLTYSRSLRKTFLKNVPPEVLSILYDK